VIAKENHHTRGHQRNEFLQSSLTIMKHEQE
jgi:hypothetical protein